MSTVRRSVAISFATRYIELIIQFASTVIIARLLTPEEIGIFSVAAVLVGLAHILRDFGVGQYVIREQQLTSEKLRNAFGVALMVAWGLALVLASISYPISVFYNEQGIRDVMLVLALNFFLIPFGSITIAYLRREMQFGILFRVNVASALVHAICAVTLASLGFSYMSMAWAAVAGVITTILVVNLYRPAGLPYLPQFKRITNIVRFGGYASTANLTEEAGRSAPDLVIGRVLSMDDVGLFGRAVGLVRLFNRLVSSAIWPVVLPYFSAVHRDGSSIKEVYLKAISYVTTLAWPFFLFLGIMAYPAVRILYGPQWDESVPLVKILCVWGAISSSIFFFNQVVTAIGYVNKTMSYQFVYQLIVILAILSSVFYGTQAVAWGISLSALIGFFVAYRYLSALAGITIKDFFASTYKSFFVASVSVVIPAVISLSMNIGPDNYLVPFIVSLFGFSISWLFAVLIVKHPIGNEIATYINSQYGNDE